MGTRPRAKKEGQPTGTATAGLVLSIIGLVVALSGLLCVAVCVGGLASAGARL